MFLAIVEVSVKPELREGFLEAITYNAVHSRQDEPGCLRFDVLQDAQSADKFYLYEVFQDDEAFAAHRETPHFKRFYEFNTTQQAAQMTNHVVRSIVPGENGWQ